jgi:hypothetical protein
MSATLLNENLGKQIVSDFRQAYLFRRQGKIQESNRLLSVDLPRAISLWARTNPQDTCTQKTQLAKIFREEQDKLEDAWTVHRAVMEQSTREIPPPMREKFIDEVKELIAEQFVILKNDIQEHASHQSMQRQGWRTNQPRIKFDDIPEIVDALQAEEQSHPRPGQAPVRYFASQLTPNETNPAEGVTGALEATRGK